MARLKRFLSPHLAEMIVSSGDESVLAHHRRDIVVLFCDLRGFTAFAETAEPEDLMRVLGEYHDAVGPLVHERHGTLDRFFGDGLMVFFNDAQPVPDAPLRAVDLAVAMRAAVARLKTQWQQHIESLGDLALKGLSRPVAVAKVLALQGDAISG
jgi:class 3 adenylate cyclase